LNNIKTVIFDFGGVLLDMDVQICVNAFARLGYDKVSELMDGYTQKDLFLLYDEGKISTDDFFIELQKRVGLHVSIEELKEAYLSFLEGLPQYKLDLLLKLRKKYKVYMLSNVCKLIFEHCKKLYFETNNHVFEDYFNKAYLSFEIGVCKPDKLIFEKMIEDSGIIPNQCLFLDDGIRNIETAKSLGFNTYLVKPKENFLGLFEDF